MHRALVRGLALTLLALVTAAPARAQPPGAPLPPPAAPAPRDSTRHRPPRLHPWLEFGGGWISGPARLRQYYEASQGFAAGLEARPAPRWALRGALDYQMLVANGWADLHVVDAAANRATTVRTRTQTTGWIAGARAEAGARLGGDFWLTAGGGGGHIHSGLSGVETDALSGYRVLTSGDVANGWGWLWTAAVRYDFTPDPRVPLGIDVRTSSLQRRHDSARTSSVRLCFRIPESGPRGAPRRRYR